MAIRTTSKTSLFLMELIVTILFFSLASTVCIQLFVKAHLLGKETTIQNHSIVLAQNIAESFYQFEGDTASMCSLLEGTMDQENSFSLYRDAEWNACDKADAAFITTFFVKQEETMVYGELFVEDVESDSQVYSLSLATHIPIRSIANE